MASVDFKVGDWVFDTRRGRLCKLAQVVAFNDDADEYVDVEDMRLPTQDERFAMGQERFFQLAEQRATIDAEIKELAAQFPKLKSKK